LAKVVRFYEAGGPEVLRVEDQPVGAPGTGEVRIRHVAVGMNFADTYFRQGYYPVPLPNGMGVEASGVIEAVGADTNGYEIGDRVTYTGSPLGAYSSERVMPIGSLFKLPVDITHETAAAMTMRGLSAAYWLLKTNPWMKAGDSILIHAAAGGVGLIVCQWAKALGATVIGTVGSDEKAELARAHGCDHPIVYTRQDFVTEVERITGGAKLPVVYDSIGRDTFMQSLDCLQPRGLMVSFGNASGPVEPISPLVLLQKGSLFLTRPTMHAYTANRAELEAAASDLFKVVAEGSVRIEIKQRFALRDAAAAHRALEARETTGSTVLTI